MKLIIELSQKDYDDIKNSNTIKNHLNSIDWAVRNGTPITDDCISREWLKRAFPYTDEWYKSRVVAQVIDNAPTIGDEEK